MIPVSEPHLGKRETELVTEAVQSGWISSAGKYIDAFEQGFADYNGVKHCVALTNGTAALEVSLHAVGVAQGDEVVIPSFTIMSVALAVLRMGAVPRVADVDSESWNITAEGVAKLVNNKTRAIIVVHGFGHPADMDPILDLANKHDLRVIEDTAESIGSRYKGRLCGTMGDVGSFSLYANKLITTGEGGCILTDHDEYAARARRYINLYFGLTERFSHDGLGYNFRMTNMQAAIGVAQLEQIENFAARKREIGRWYAEALADCDTVDFQKTVGDVDHVYWMYCMVLKEHAQMDAVAAMDHLKARGVGTRNLFKGLHAQAPLQPHLIPADKDADFPVTEHLYARGFYVPSAVTLKREHVETVVDALRELR
jgi:perosamine synthetase